MADQVNPNAKKELATSLRSLATRIEGYEGELPGYISLTFAYNMTFKGQDIDNVDQLATTLIGITGTPQKSGRSWYHQAETLQPGGLKVNVYTNMLAPAEEDPAALRARIAELETRLAQERGEA